MLTPDPLAATRLVFRRVATDREEWRSEDDLWHIEKSWLDGPRGGRKLVWHLWRVDGDRLGLVATEIRLRDLWSHVV